MTLLVPNYQEYKNSVDKLQEFLNKFKGRVSWTIYGSFTNGKLRCGLSDIDIFMVAESQYLAFPIDIGMAFSEVKSSIENIGIPLQVNKLTTHMLENQFASPDFGYLLEVRKGVQMGYSSPSFHNNFVKFRDETQDDLHMARYFLRKVNNIGSSLGEIEEVILKNKEDISLQDQKNIWGLWDNFKKMLSLITVAVRILENESLFAEPDDHIIDRFQEKLELSIDYSLYINLMEKIQNIENWYEYLKNGGIQELVKIYNEIFTPFLNSLGNKLSEYYK